MGDMLSAHVASIWSGPLEMLDVSHRNFQRQLQAVWRVAEQTSRYGADESTRLAAMGILRYFSTVAYQHQEDEEHDLFPAVLGAIPRSERRQTKALIDRLLDDHRRMAEVRERILAKLFAVTQGKIPTFHAEEIDTFASVYLEHMRLESEQLLPLARRVLQPGQIRSLTVTMAVRRGVGLAELPASCATW